MLIKRIYSTAWNSVSLFMLVYQYFINREGFGPYKFSPAILFYLRACTKPIREAPCICETRLYLSF